jgi:hypothetical protein
MSEASSDAQTKAAARQAKLLAKSAERLAKITGSAGEGRVFSDCMLIQRHCLESLKY